MVILYFFIFIMLINLKIAQGLTIFIPITEAYLFLMPLELTNYDER